MPRYFFHLIDDLDTTDEEGVELADDGAAYAWAVKSARALMCDSMVRTGTITLHHRIEIEDADHRALRRVEFKSAVEIVP